MRRGLNVAWGVLPVLLVCGLAVGGCTQPETPDAGEAAEHSAPPASPTATSSEDAEPTQMPAAAPPADESSSPAVPAALPAPAASAASHCDTDWGSLVKAAPADNPEMAGKYALLQRACGTPCLLRPAGVELHRTDQRRLLGGLRRPGLAAASPDGDVAGGARRSQARDRRRQPRVKVRTRKPASRSSRSKAGAPSVRWSLPARSRDKASSASACGTGCPSGPLCWPVRSTEQAWWWTSRTAGDRDLMHMKRRAPRVDTAGTIRRKGRGARGRCRWLRGPLLHTPLLVVGVVRVPDPAQRVRRRQGAVERQPAK